MRVALTDDSTLFRRGLRHLLEELGIAVAAECADGDELLETLRTDNDIDAVVIDIRMPPTFTEEGLRTAAQVRREYPHIGVLVLSTYAEPRYAEQLLASGSSHLGYLLKDRVDDPAVITDALERLCAGGSVVDPEVVERLVTRNERVRTLSRLTDRERSVLSAMAEGRSNQGISHRLYLSPKTVEAHIATILRKLDMTSEQDDNRRVRAVLRWLDAEPMAGR